MNYPKMIIFDYGHTLCCEPGWDSTQGNEALLRHATKNKYGISAEDLQKGAENIFGVHVQNIRNIGYDVNAQIPNRFLYEYLGLEFELSPFEIEVLFWKACAPGAIMPNVDKLLNYLNEKGIRTAVISNIGWSGDALRERLNRLLPNNHFEFVIASSDYLFRKPEKLLFELALRKAELHSDEVWYCGDNPQADIEGSASAGIFPVWYDNALECDYRDKSKETKPECEHLHIHEWDKLIELLERLQ
ncbi:MAG: HAD family hydrolase [Eubacteriales bacterium]|nr:HAD family hydrolase [Eubacteriales bacterium]